MISQPHNNPIKLSVCSVTPLACASVAPEHPAAYRVRYANLRSRTRSVNWMSSLAFILVILVLAGTLAACAPTHQRPSSDAHLSVEAGIVTLLRIDPPEDTILRRGLKIPITITAGYELKVSPAGAIGVFVQDQYGHSLVVGSRTTAPVKRGRGEATINTDILIPNMSAKKAVVYVALKADGYAGTSAVGRVEYKVMR